MTLDSVDREARLKEIKDAIRTTPDFPKSGVLFRHESLPYPIFNRFHRDIFGVFKNPTLTQYLFSEIECLIKEKLSSDPKIDAVICPDARGFLFGPTVAVYLNCAFVPARKAGKLPGSCYSLTYDLEYGTATLEIQCDALNRGDRVLVIDDLLATGGSLKTCVGLTRLANAVPVAAVTVMELESLGGRAKLEVSGVPVYSLFTF